MPCVAQPLLLCKENETKDLLREAMQLSFVEVVIDYFIIKAAQITREIQTSQCCKLKSCFKYRDSKGLKDRPFSLSAAAFQMPFFPSESQVLVNVLHAPLEQNSEVMNE